MGINHKALALLLAAAMALSLCACGAPVTSDAQSTDSSVESVPAATEAVQEVVPEDDGITRITLADGNIQIDGKGAGVDEELDKVTIKSGGVYELTGTLESGRVVVKTNPDDVVELILNGVDITSAGNDAIFCKKAGAFKITLAEGTENTLTSGGPEFLEAALAGEPLTPVDDEATEAAEETDDETDAVEEDLLPKSQKAALYSKAPMYITGTGSLTVKGYINNGIQAKPDLTIDTANITVESTGDAVKSKGAIDISSGVYDIHAYGDAIDTDGDLTISGGEFTILTGDGSAAVTMKTEFGFGGGPGRWNWNNFDMDDTDMGSQKGLKAEGALTVSGGTFSIDSADDGFHCGSAALISGGNLEIASGDDGVHSDDTLDITGGTVTVSYCYEGVEAPHITVEDGDISVTTTDDGFNAGGDITGSPSVTINGGNIYVNAGGDGLDSNGDMTINGGVIRVDGPSDSMNGALDIGSESGGKLLVNGGELLAVGTSGMLETPEKESEQVCLTYVFTSYMPEGTEMVISDSEGTEIFRFTTIKRANAVTVSSPAFKLNETYSFTYGETTETLEATSMSTSNQGGWGFGGGPGGMGRPPEFR